MTLQTLSPSTFRASALGAVMLLTLGLAALEAAAEVTFDWVIIGDPGNVPDTEVMECCDGAEGTTGFGSVAYSYRVGKYEVSNGQYAEFLNAVDPTGENLLSLYSSEMTSYLGLGGIDLDLEAPPGSRYAAKANFEQKPVIFVSFIDAIRLANWLHNGQGSGDTETGAYTLMGGGAYPTNTTSVLRNPDAQFFVPSEDEWYKSAYYDTESGVYYDFPGGSDTETVCAVPSTTSNTGNCNQWVPGLTHAGNYWNSVGTNGTFDQDGNVTEWTDTRIGPSLRVVRGGSWAKSVSFNASAFQYGGGNPPGDEIHVGIRIAASFVEPPGGAPVPLLPVGGVAVLYGLLASTGLLWMRPRCN